MKTKITDNAAEPNIPEPSEAEEGLLFEHYRIEADKKQSLLRIDKFLTDRLPNTSRNKIQNAIEAGLIKVNEREVKSNYKIKPQDIVTVSLPVPPRDTEVKPENIPLNIVYEDEDLLVVNKPAGMVVHPAYNNWSGTLANALVYHFQNLPELAGNEGRPGLVHRIDKDTSGLLVIAKSELAMMRLAKQFFDHSIERSYLALVWGEPEPEADTVNIPLMKSPKDRRVVTAAPNEEIGKRAITHYKTLQKLRYVSLLECRLETGRTHQIRAHMRHIGHPVFNDPVYGGDKIVKGTLFSKYKGFVENCFSLLPGQALHARSLGFVHPRTGEKMHFEAPLPESLKHVLEKWEKYTTARE